MSRKILTLCIPHEHPRVLLGMKKRGFGAGRWNGFGGKVHEGETIEAAARRELQEEAGIALVSIEKRGTIDFEFQGNPEFLEVHVFKGRGIVGEPRETEEMRPQWFFVDEIPFADMWPDDRYWFPFFLKDRNFRAQFFFGRGDRILKMEVQEAV